MITNPPIRELVKDLSWQKVREDLVGKWNKNSIYCCNEIGKWLGLVINASDKKLAIVANYLTGSAFRMGKIKHSCVSKIRGSVFGEIKKRKILKKWTL